MNSSAVRALALEYKSLMEDMVEGFRVKLLSDENLFEWSVSARWGKKEEEDGKKLFMITKQWNDLKESFVTHIRSLIIDFRLEYSAHQRPSTKADILRWASHHRDLQFFLRWTQIRCSNRFCNELFQGPHQSWNRFLCISMFSFRVV